MSAIKRLPREYAGIQKEPIENLLIKPSVDNILTWFFVIKGHKDTPYDGGLYAGKIVFPAEYPFKAPDIIMLTPSGRFEVGKKICLSYTGYHQETWNPMWTINTMIRGFISFMYSNDITVGSITSTDDEKKLLVADSKRHVIAIPEIALLFGDDL
jgi:ubiquitin-conjugating enzyme E2 J2